MQKFLSSAASFLTGGGVTAAESQQVAGTDGPILVDTLQSKGSEGAGNGDTKKRPINVESPEGRPKKRLDRRSEDEKRLTGYYSAPKSAQPIQLPTRVNSGQPEEISRTRAMAQKPGARGAHRPRDTLSNASPHAAHPRRPDPSSIFPRFTRKNEIHRKSTTGQGVTSGRHHTLTNPPTPTRSGDGFEDDELEIGIRPNHARKRQKLDVASTKVALSSSPVDLTGDDAEGEVEVVKLNGRTLPQTAVHSQRGFAGAERPTEQFRVSEWKNVSNLTTVVPAKSKRKSKDGPGSSQASSRGTPAEVPDGRSSLNGYNSQNTTEQPLDHELDLDKRNSTMRSERLPINLDDGLGKLKKSREQMSPEERKEDVQRSAEVMQRQSPRSGRGRGSSYGMHGRPLTHRRVITQPPRHDNAIHNDGSKPSAAQRLDQTFVRDDTPKPKAKDRMKAESKGVGKRVSPIDDGQGSPDELTGATTIRSQPSRSVSPQKKSATRPSPARELNNRDRSKSPADLRETQFKNGQYNSQAKRPNLEQDGKCHLRALHATSCTLTSGTIELRYDEEEKQFDLYHNGHIQIVWDKKRAVSISQSEVSKIFLCKGQHRVYLTGPKTEVSNGYILIEFFDWEDVQDFTNLLIFITNEHVAIEAIDADRLNKVFLNKSSEIEKMFRQQSKQHDKGEYEIEELARAKRGVSPRAEDEGIQYESFQSQRVTSQRVITRHRSGHGLLEQSPYFLESQPRRSSRQPKQSKPLSPSPPPLRRWTEENKLQPWAHPVVYPTEGLRRITVDFQDMGRLDEGCFLNDNLVSFALRQIQENISPDHRESVYFFNSFFYTALTSKSGRNSFNYGAVKRWTKSTDLLGYQYVVVPICVDAHWFVVIICNLREVSRRAAGLTDYDDKEMDVEEGTLYNEFPATQDTEGNGEADDMLDKNPGVASPRPDAAPSSRTLADGVDGVEIRAQTKAMSQLSLEQEESKAKSGSGVSTSGGRVANLSTSGGFSTPTGKLTRNKKSKKKAPPPLKKYDPDQPTLITLDSLGIGHTAATRNLKEYLRAEAEERRGMDIDTKQLQGMVAKGIPQQPNFCDCGLYLIGYVEEFAKDPRRFVTKVLTRQMDREADFTSFDPSGKRDEIRTELLKLYEEQNAGHKAKKSTKKSNAKSMAEAPASSPTPAPATSVKLQQPPVPTPAVASNELTNRIPQHGAQSTPVLQPNSPFDDRENDELEQSIPRALEERNALPAKSTAKAKASILGARISPEDMSQQMTRIAPDENTDMVNTTHEENGLQPTEEEMLFSDDGPDEGPAAERSAAAHVGSDGDLLSGLEGKLGKNQEQLEIKRIAKRAAEASVAQLSNGKAGSTLCGQKPKNDPQVIDLDVDDDKDLVIPDSQEKQAANSKSRRQAKH